MMVLAKRMCIPGVACLLVVCLASGMLGLEHQRHAEARRLADEWWRHPTERTFCEGYWTIGRDNGARSEYLDTRCEAFHAS